MAGNIDVKNSAPSSINAADRAEPNALFAKYKVPHEYADPHKRAYLGLFPCITCSLTHVLHHWQLLRQRCCMGSSIRMVLAMSVKPGCAQALVNSYSMWMEFGIERKQSADEALTVIYRIGNRFA